MAAQLSFDNCVLSGTTVAATAFVRGGSYNPDLQISRVFTADGKLHQQPLYKGGTASVKLYGDYTSLNTPAADGSTETGNADTIVLKSGSTTLLTTTGLITASYDEMDHTTSVEMKMDPDLTPAD